MDRAGTFISDLFSGKLLSLEEALWGGLVIGLIITTLHLITMLTTRWGDRRATAKACVFSFLVHATLFSGLTAVESSRRDSGPAGGKEDHLDPVKDHEFFVVGEENVQADQPGNSPVWDQPPEMVDGPLARSGQPLREATQAEAPERVTEVAEQPEIAIPDRAVVPDQPMEIPAPETISDEPLQANAAAPPQGIDDPTAEARPDVEVPSAVVQRQGTARATEVESDVSREPAPSEVETALPEVPPSQVPTSPEGLPEPEAIVERSDESLVSPGLGPAPAMVDIEEPGPVSEGPPAGAPEPGTAPQRIGRSAMPRRGAEDGIVDRFLPEPSPDAPRAGGDEQIATLPVPERSLDAPGGTAPSVLRPDFDTVIGRNANVPPTYRLRNLQNRADSARKYGGTERSEEAVEMSLAWLASVQEPEGRWDAEEHGAGQGRGQAGVDRRDAGREADTGVTALAILAFLGAGYTHEDGKFSEEVEKALRWLVSQQAEDGSLAGNATHYERMYCHGMATYALAEAYAMQSDPTLDTGLRAPLEKAVKYIVDAQSTDHGGWRYVKNSVEGDMSMFGWQLMALKSAELAGIPIPEKSRTLMITFLRERGLGDHGGLASYRQGEEPTPSMTAEALFCKQILGILRTNPASVEAAEFLGENLPKLSETNEYYWYYGTLAMYQYGGDAWKQWNEALRDLLLSEQRKRGEFAGSWDPKGPWGAYGGRVYTTALSTLCLEVYYRFLPLYRVGGRYEETR